MSFFQRLLRKTEDHNNPDSPLKSQKTQNNLTEPNEENSLSVTNPFHLIESDEDVTIFVTTFRDVIFDSLDNKIISKEAQQLLWLLVWFVYHQTNKEEHSFESIQTLLDKTCTPVSYKEVQNAFDILIGDCTQPDIKEKYEYFKYNVYGLHSNCYKRIVSECLDLLTVLPADDFLEEFQKNKQNQTVPVDENIKFLFGKLAYKTGQVLQIDLYEKQATAIHEAGHAVAHYLLNVPFDGVDIIPADDHCGIVKAAPSFYEADASDKAVIFFAGSVAEDIVFQPSFSRVWNASYDFNWATKIIKEEIITQYSEPGQAQKYIFIDPGELGLAAHESPYIVFETIKRCVELRQAAFDLISANLSLVEALAHELLEKKIMTSEEVISFLDERKKISSTAQ